MGDAAWAEGGAACVREERVYIERLQHPGGGWGADSATRPSPRTALLHHTSAAGAAGGAGVQGCRECRGAGGAGGVGGAGGAGVKGVYVQELQVLKKQVLPPGDTVTILAQGVKEVEDAGGGGEDHPKGGQGQRQAGRAWGE